MEEEDYLTKKEYFKATAGIKMVLGAICLGLILTPLVDYALKGVQTGEWTLKGQKIHKEETNSSYKKLFKDATTLEDSINVLRKHGLQIKLEEPSFEEKERVLEGMVE